MKRIITAAFAAATLAGGITSTTGTAAAHAKIDSGNYTLTGHAYGLTAHNPVQIRGNKIIYTSPYRVVHDLHHTKNGGFYDDGPSRYVFHRTRTGNYTGESYLFGIQTGTFRMVHRG